jgi:hypothetical protein
MKWMQIIGEGMENGVGIIFFSNIFNKTAFHDS